MPQSVPTWDEFNAEISALKARVAALEDGDPPLPPPAPTASLSGPISVEVGQTYQLTIATTGATSVFLDGVSWALNGTVSRTADVSGIVLHILKAVGPGGSASDNLTILVTDPVPPPDGDVPPVGSDVVVPVGAMRTVSADWDVRDIVVHGWLVFDQTRTVTVRCRTLTVPDGVLEIVPDNPTVKHSLVFADVPLDPADAEQMGNGLVVTGGRVLIEGPSGTWFVRLDLEALVGDFVLLLAEPAEGWQAGDRLVLPDSKQWAAATGPYVPEWETATVAAVSLDGLTVTLTAPLKFNHRGARDGDGVLEILPHVANLTRNVVVKSENASGTRGHCLFSGLADVTIRNTQFQSLGRATLDPVGPGNVAGRYPVHFHHLRGPATPQPSGHQFIFEGNAVFCGLPTHRFKWGITIHDSHYGLIRGNVLYNWAGAALMAEDGSESFNVIEKNIAIRGRGESGSDIFGNEGTGFWFRGPNNIVRDNVATGWTNPQIGSVYGFNFNFRYLGNIRVPRFRGADTTLDSEVDIVHGNAMPLREFEGNEVYGMENGLTLWWVNAQDTIPQNGGETAIEDFRAWHFSFYGVYGYPMANVTFDGLVLRGDKSVLSNPHEVPQGVTFGDYMAKDIVVRNANIQGLRIGIEDPYFGGTDASGHTTVIRNSYLRNAKNIVVKTIGAPGSGGSGSWRHPKTLTILNVQFGSTAGWNLGDGAVGKNIVMHYTEHGGAANLILPDTAFVYDDNGVVGENYQVYYTRQRADEIVPQTSENGWLKGSPEAGLTNRENRAKYGISIAGDIAPDDAVVRPDIDGLVRVIQP